MNEPKSYPPLAEPFDRAMMPFRRFMHLEMSGGIVLFGCAAVALVWANSPWAASYFAAWETIVTAKIGEFGISKKALLWINDALMAAFFFVVGLEIKREILVGELASVRQAALPIAAAVGGMIVPAGIYAALNYGTEGIRGWGVPMATDIAFALGVLAVLGSRVPMPAKVFLTAVAIVDDIGASLVIALFYTDNISWLALAIGFGFWFGQIGLNLSGVRRPTPYAILGLGLWIAFLKSGVHPTVAGILGAMSIPAYTSVNAVRFLEGTRSLLEEFKSSGEKGTNVLTNNAQRDVLESVERLSEEAQAPLQRLEHAMLPWVSFGVMPLFALANAGVALDSEAARNISHPVALGTILGLVFGKQIGILGFTWLTVALGISRLPTGVRWMHIYGLSCLAGIGFTMSLFIASLAFEDTPLLPIAKIGILSASIVAGGIGWFILWRVGKPGSGDAAVET